MQKIKKMIITTLLLVALTFCVTEITGNAFVINVEASVKAPSVKTENKTLYIGDQAYTIKFSNLSKNASITYKSENPKVAKVTAKGSIQPIAKGTTIIKALVKQNDKTYHLKVTVKVKSHTNAEASGTTAKSDLKEEGKKLTAEEIYEKCIPATVEINSDSADGSALGSGFFIDNGIIVTNYHVIEGTDNITVKTSDGKEYEVTDILGYDAKLDLAILKINSKNEIITINTHEIKAGDDIYTLGSPLGLTGTMTKGMVSTASRTIDEVNYVQIDAAISKGNSGGPLLNVYGEVIGVNTMYYKYGQNLNFAISISELKKIETNNPLSVAEYNVQYLEAKQKETLTNLVYENPVFSKNADLCQYIPADTMVKGTLTVTEDGDTYNLEMKDSGWLIINMNLDNAEAVKYMNLKIYSASFLEKGIAVKDEESKIERLACYLAPGRYYICMTRADISTGDNINYQFVTSQKYNLYQD